MMVSNIKKTINELCPLKHFKIKKLREPWISNELLEQMKDKDRLLRKATKSKKSDDWKAAKRARNECAANVRRAKSDFVNLELANNMDDSKTFLKNIHDILPTGSKSQNRINLTGQKTN